jgi:hypothetical protein
VEPTSENVYGSRAKGYESLGIGNRTGISQLYFILLKSQWHQNDQIVQLYMLPILEVQYGNLYIEKKTIMIGLVYCI